MNKIKIQFNFTNHFLKSIILFTSIFLYSGCNILKVSSKGEDTKNKLIIRSISGKAIDGYIKNANVCIDINKNNKCDDNEPSTKTQTDGTFSLKITIKNIGHYTVIITGGIDTATNKPFQGTLKDIINVKNNNVDILNLRVTPLTTISTLIYEEEIKSNPNYKIKTAKQIIAKNLDLNLSQINTDPLKDKAVFIITQQIIQTIKILSKTIQKNESDNIKNKNIFNHIIKQVALSVKNEHMNSDLNISKIVKKLKTTIYNGLTINIPVEIERFIKNYTKEIRIKTEAISDIDSLDNLQNKFETFIDEIKTQIEQNNTKNLSLILINIKDNNVITIIKSTNRLPIFTSNNIVNVNEKQISAITLNATDMDNDTLTYSIKGTDSNSFNIDSSTGVITFKVAPDYETKISYTFVAIVNDGKSNVNQTILINIIKLNNTNDDIDKDGTLNINDAFPNNPKESIDTDRDGIGDNADTDDDNDGILDINDNFPKDASNGLGYFIYTIKSTVIEAVETRCNKPNINYSNQTLMRVRLGTNSFCRISYLKFNIPKIYGDINETTLHLYPTKGKGSVEVLEVNTSIWNKNTITYTNAPIKGKILGKASLLLNSWINVNISGYINKNGIYSLALDEPNNAEQRYETEVSTHPPYITIKYKTTIFDTDGDGIHNYDDNDDDNDGVTDDKDAFPLNPNEQLDTDNDGVGNNSDIDDDNDGVNDDKDAFPLNPNETLDTDGDGIGNNSDIDDDNDGIPDSYEVANNLNPLIDDSTQDPDNDGYDNLYEYRAKTNPKNNSSIPQVGFRIKVMKNGKEITFDKNNPINLSEEGNETIIISLVLTHASTFEVRFNVEVDDDSEVHVDKTALYIGEVGKAWWKPIYITIKGVNDALSDGNISSQVRFKNINYLNSNYKNINVAPFYIKTIDNEPFIDSDNDGVPDGNDALPYNPKETIDSDNDGWGDNQDDFPQDSTRHSFNDNLLLNPSAINGEDYWNLYADEGLITSSINNIIYHTDINSFNISINSIGSGYARYQQNIILPKNTIKISYGGWINVNTLPLDSNKIKYGIEVTDYNSNIYYSATSSIPKINNWKHNSKFFTVNSIPLTSVKFRILIPKEKVLEFNIDDLEVFAFTNIDTDNDGILDYQDNDDDNDGFLDGEDNAPLDATPQNDFDNDGKDDLVDKDDDNDNVPDLIDAYPHDATRWQVENNSKILLSKTFVEVSELKNSDSFGVSLNQAPTSNVKINFNVNDTTEIKLSTNSLIFTPSNWNIIQTIIVTGIDDTSVDGDKYIIIETTPAISNDSNFNGDNVANILALNKDDKGYIVELNDGSKYKYSDLPSAIEFSLLEENFLSVIQIDEKKIGGNGILLSVNAAGVLLYNSVEDTSIDRHSIASVAHEGDGHIMFTGAEIYNNKVYIKTTTILGPKDKYMRISDLVDIYKINSLALPYYYIDKDTSFDNNNYMYITMFSNYRNLSERSKKPIGGRLFYTAPKFMELNTKYYSWDTHYYYTTPEAMYKDSIKNIHTNAVNSNNILINRYLWRSLNVPTYYTIDELYTYMERNLGNTKWQKSMFSQSKFNYHKDAFDKVVKSNFNIAVMISVSKTETEWGRSDEGWQDFDPFNHSSYVYTDNNASHRIIDWPIYWRNKLSTLESPILGRKGLGIGAKYNGKTVWATTTASHYFIMDRALGFKDYNSNVPLYTIYGKDSNGDGVLD